MTHVLILLRILGQEGKKVEKPLLGDETTAFVFETKSSNTS